MKRLTERLTAHFLSGQATRDEARIVVRHLLTQCLRCATGGRGQFFLPFQEVPLMTDAEAVAQAQLDILVRVLEMLGESLRRIDRELPPSPQEMSREDEGSGSDVTSEIHRAIQCALADHVNPVTAALRAASIYKPAAAPESKKRVRRPGKDRRKKKAGGLRKRKA